MSITISPTSSSMEKLDHLLISLWKIWTTLMTISLN